MPPLHIPPADPVDHDLPAVRRVRALRPHRRRQLYNTRFPSGVQPRAVASSGYHVSRLGIPPSVDTTYTCGDPLRSDVNAIHLPSGEKCGLLSTAGVLVIRVASPPSLGTTQISPPYSKAICVALRQGCRKSRVPCAAATNTFKTDKDPIKRIRENKSGRGIIILIVAKFNDFG